MKNYKAVKCDNGTYKIMERVFFFFWQELLWGSPGDPIEKSFSASYLAKSEIHKIEAKDEVVKKNRSMTPNKWRVKKINVGSGPKNFNNMRYALQKRFLLFFWRDWGIYTNTERDECHEACERSNVNHEYQIRQLENPEHNSRETWTVYRRIFIFFWRRMVWQDGNNIDYAACNEQLARDFMWASWKLSV